MQTATTKIFEPAFDSDTQVRYKKYCRRYGIPSDKVTFLNKHTVKIRCGKVFKTLQTATALLGYIPFVFRKEEGYFGSYFEFNFEGNHCYITFRKRPSVPQRQKRLVRYFQAKPPKEYFDVSFVNDYQAKVAYGNLSASAYTNGVLLRRIPYEFRFLEKLYNLPVTYEYKEDGFCYITFKK